MNLAHGALPTESTHHIWPVPLRSAGRQDSVQRKFRMQRLKNQAQNSQDELGQSVTVCYGTF